MLAPGPADVGAGVSMLVIREGVVKNTHSLARLRPDQAKTALAE